MRLASLAALFALVLSACSVQDRPATYGSGIEQSSPPRARSPEPANPSAPGNPVVPQTRQTAGPLAPSGQTPSPYADAGGVGAMALTYLRSSPARRLVVEVDYVRGRAPRSSALSHLEDVLARECAKPDGVTVRRDDEIPDERSEWGFSDIADLERRYRSNRSSGSRATVWLVYLSGGLKGEDGTLGVALSASTAAVFADEIDGAATSLVLPGAIERAVVTHEAGHLLALVDIGYRSVHDHEDPDHPNHSSSKRSVMYWAIEDISIGTLLSGGPPDDFDDDDRDDLRMLRTG
jgi:hypothetical protein